MPPDAVLAACRFAHDTATLLLWGAFAYLAFLVPDPLGDETQRRLEGFRCCTVAVAASTTAATLPVEVAAIGAGWGDVGDPATVEAVLFETSAGIAWTVQAILAILLVATLLVPARSCRVATALTAGLLLASLALTGHAALHEGLLGELHRLNDLVHLLAGGAWLGALVPLLVILTALDDPVLWSDAGKALRRFSTAGHCTVALVFATGAANTALILHGWPTAWASPYQALLSLKIALVVVMAALAVANRYVLVPWMARGNADAGGAFRLLTVLEMGLGVAAVACVGVFGLLEPS